MMFGFSLLNVSNVMLEQGQSGVSGANSLSEASSKSREAITLGHILFCLSTSPILSYIKVNIGQLVFLKVLLFVTPEVTGRN